VEQVRRLDDVSLTLPIASDTYTELANSTTQSMCIAVFLQRPYRGSPYTMLKAEKSTLLYIALVLFLNASDVAQKLVIPIPKLHICVVRVRLL